MEPFPYFRQGRIRPGTPPVRHHGFQQRLPGRQIFRIQGDHIPRELAGRVPQPINLLGSRGRYLARTQFHHRLPIVAYQFVRHIGIGRIRGNADLGTDAENINGRAALRQFRNPVFIQPAADHDLRIIQPGGIQNRPYLPAQLGVIPGIQPHPGQTVAGGRHFLPHAGGVMGSGDSVIGIQQQDGVLGKGGGVGPESVNFRRKGGDVGMGHRAGRRDAVALRRQGIAGGLKSGNIAGPGHRQRRIGPGRAPRPEIRHYPSPGGSHAAGGDSSLQTLKVQPVNQPGFGQLRLDNRRRYFHEGRIAKIEPPFSQSPDAAAKAQPGQILQKLPTEPPGFPQELNAGRAKMQVLQKLQPLRQPGAYQIAPIGRQIADKKAEHRRPE